MITSAGQVQRDRIVELVRVCDCIYDSLALLEQPSLQRLIESWQVTRSKYIAVAQGRVPGVKIAKIVSEFENGLVETISELPEILHHAPATVIKEAVDIFQRCIKIELPGLIEKKLKRNDVSIKKIIKRGAIKGESEFYLIRQAIDALEKDADDEKLQLFYSLVDQYES